MTNYCLCYIRTKNFEAVKKLSKSCQIRLTAKNNTVIIFQCNLFNLAMRAKTSNVLAG